jgi:EF hand
MKTTLLPTLTLVVTAFALVAQEPKGPPPGGAGQKGQGQKGPPAQKGGQSGQGGQGFRPPQHPLELALDANNDGVIDAKELANAAFVLKRLDKNGDGRLTDDEFRPMRPGGGFGGPGGQGGQGGQGGPSDKGPGQKGGQGGQGGQGGEPGAQAPKADGDFVARLFQNDKNNDGKISKSELPEALQSIFERADTNKDGEIDRQEAGVLAERMKSRTGSQGTDGKRPPLEK